MKPNLYSTPDDRQLARDAGITVARLRADRKADDLKDKATLTTPINRAALTPAQKAQIDALTSFVETIEQTGGVTKHTGKHDGGPTVDPEWLDLGEAYRKGCAVLGRKPVIVEV